MESIPYAYVLGSLIYSHACTRPDINVIIGILSRYQKDTLVAAMEQVHSFHLKDTLPQKNPVYERDTTLQARTKMAIDGAATV